MVENSRTHAYPPTLARRHDGSMCSEGTELKNSWPGLPFARFPGEETFLHGRSGPALDRANARGITYRYKSRPPIETYFYLAVYPVTKWKSFPPQSASVHLALASAELLVVPPRDSGSEEDVDWYARASYGAPFTVIARMARYFRMRNVLQEISRCPRGRFPHRAIGWEKQNRSRPRRQAP